MKYLILLFLLISTNAYSSNDPWALEADLQQHDLITDYLIAGKKIHIKVNTQTKQDLRDVIQYLCDVAKTHNVKTKIETRTETINCTELTNE